MRVSDAIRILGGSRAEALARIAEREERAQLFLAHHSSKEGKKMSVDDVRLKDIRRAYARYLRRERGALFDLFALASLFSEVSWPNTVQRDLDRVISVFGADTTLAAVFARLRKEAERIDHVIGTDDVSASLHTNQDSPTHGGDGNSGECDVVALTSTQDPRPQRREEEKNSHTPDGTSTAEAGSQGLGDGACETNAEDADRSNADGVTPACRGDDGADEATVEMGANCADQRSATNQHLDQASQGPDQGGASEAGADHATEAGQDALPGHRLATDDGADDRDGGAGISGSPASASHDGGDDLDEAAAMERLASSAVRRDALRLERAICLLIESTCATRGAQSARYDGRRLIKELVARRYALHRARREEHAIRDIVIAVDVSGSCAGVVDSTYAAALSAARVLPRERVTVITHSNGYCVNTTQYCPAWMKTTLARWPAVARDYFSTSQQEASREVWQEIAARRPGMVLVLGDLDSAWAHDILHDAGVRVVLMTDIERSQYQGCTPYEVCYGVRDIHTAAEAAERLVRSKSMIKQRR